MEALVPLRHLSLNMNVCGFRCRLGVGYSDEEAPLEEREYFLILGILTARRTK